jgi:hypothetical protein
MIQTNMKNNTETGKVRKTILLIVASVLLLMLVVSFLICHYSIMKQAHVGYMGIMNVASEKISKTVGGMEMNAMNVFDEVGKHMDSPESVIDALKSKTSLNPDVKGYFAAFVPNYFPQKGQWFEPYVHRTDSRGGFTVRDVGSASHDYTKSDWYIQALDAKGSFWSDPYFYYDGTGISGRYCTFVKPVFDASGRLACVCGADMTFEWLTNELKRMDDATRRSDMLSKFRMFAGLDFYTVLLDKDGNCIAYPLGRSAPLKDEEVLRNLAAKKSGSIDVTVNGVPSTAYYAPMEHIGWSVAVIVPDHVVWKPLLIVGAILLGVAVFGLLVVWLALRRGVNQRKEA